MEDMQIELARAGSSDAGLIKTLLDEYLRELSRHREVPIGATDSASYPYLDAYWSESDRHAYIIQCGGRAVGFALIRDLISTGSAIHQFAEFYVRPESRRLGIGCRTVLVLWKRFPGQWELQVHARNSAAVQFWEACIEAATSESPQMHKIQAQDGLRVQFNFSVEDAV